MKESTTPPKIKKFGAVFSLTFFSFVLFFGVFLRGGYLLPPTAFAVTATSTNFTTQSVVDTGGSHSTSTSFMSAGALGQPATGISTSTNYTLKAGILYFVGGLFPPSSLGASTISSSQIDLAWRYNFPTPAGF